MDHHKRGIIHSSSVEEHRHRQRVRFVVEELPSLTEGVQTVTQGSDSCHGLGLTSIVSEKLTYLGFYFQQLTYYLFPSRFPSFISFPPTFLPSLVSEPCLGPYVIHELFKVSNNNNYYY